MSRSRYKFGKRAYAYSLVPTLRVGTSVRDALRPIGRRGGTLRARRGSR